MTMPSERSVAVEQTRMFLESLAHRRDYRVPRVVRAEAYRLLRHYPSTMDIMLLAKAFPLMWGDLEEHF